MTNDNGYWIIQKGRTYFRINEKARIEFGSYADATKMLMVDAVAGAEYTKGRTVHIRHEGNVVYLKFWKTIGLDTGRMPE